MNSVTPSLNGMSHAGIRLSKFPVSFTDISGNVCKSLQHSYKDCLLKEFDSNCVNVLMSVCNQHPSKNIGLST